MARQRRMIEADGMTERVRHLWVMAFVLMVSCSALACNVPIYQYALQRWPRVPYRVYYLHEGDGEKPSEDQLEVNKYLANISFVGNGYANLIFISVDVSDELPTEVERIWPDNCDQTLPFHAVFSPRSQPFMLGTLSMKQAKLMVDSAKRQQLAKLLAKGTQGVLLLLLRGDEKAQSKARKAVQEAIKTAKEHDADAGLIELRPDDPKEELLVRQLLHLESDLEQLDEPMVFPVFGRGYAMTPFVGEGITQSNMEAVIQFLLGPCSCGLRASGLGVDLLTNVDWEDAILGPTGEPRPLIPGGYVTF